MTEELIRVKNATDVFRKEKVELLVLTEKNEGERRGIMMYSKW